MRGNGVFLLSCSVTVYLTLMPLVAAASKEPSAMKALPETELLTQPQRQAQQQYTQQAQYRYDHDRYKRQSEEAERQKADRDRRQRQQQQNEWQQKQEAERQWYDEQYRQNQLATERQAKQKAEQKAQKEEAQRQARREENEKREAEWKRLTDPDDVIAKVLNYSSYGNEVGLAISTTEPPRMFWYHENKDNPCRYRHWGTRITAEDVRMNPGTLHPWMITEDKLIDLDSLDPRLIKMGENYRGDVTGVFYDGSVLIPALGAVDIDRLVRGWTLIYSKHCTGKQRPF